MTKIFIGGFPQFMTELELVQLIDPFGRVNTVKIVRDKVTKKCKGYAFVEMADLESADRVISGLNNTVLGDKVLSVNFAEEKSEPAKFPVNRNPAGYIKVERPVAGGKPKRPRK